MKIIKTNCISLQCMIEIKLEENVLQKAAEEGMDVFLQAIVDTIYDAIGGELTADSMQQLNSDQITLLAYHVLHQEVMDGGFVQLIHNGYGPFIFKNPFDKALKSWDIYDLSKMIGKCHKLYRKYAAELEQDCSDDEFMALFEKYPAFDDFDDEFVENEERWTENVARYVDDHIGQFVKIVKE